MSKYTYKCFTADFVPTEGNRDEQRIAMARVNFNANPLDEFYVIYINGRMNRIEFEENFPYPEATTELSAQAHIAVLEAEQAVV